MWLGFEVEHSERTMRMFEGTLPERVAQKLNEIEKEHGPVVGPWVIAYENDKNEGIEVVSLVVRKRDEDEQA